MRRHHAGSGRRRVIPVGWAATHRPVVAATFTVRVEIREPGGAPSGEFDKITGKRPIEPHAPHYGAGATKPNARVQAIQTTGTTRESGEQTVTVAGYLVVVDRDTSTATGVDHIVKVTAVDDNGDPALVGRELRVTGVAYGSLSWERDLTCLDDLG